MVMNLPRLLSSEVERRLHLKRRLNRLRRKKHRLIVGIAVDESASMLDAAIVSVSGSGDETVLMLKGFASRELPEELSAAIAALGSSDDFEYEDAAGINFLILHNMMKLYEQLLDSSGIASNKVDLISVEDFQVGDFSFPIDPMTLSEMTNRLVSSRFYIGSGDEKSEEMPVSRALLRSMLDHMIDRFGLDTEVRKAAAVALLGNEAIFNERASEVVNETGAGERKRRRALKTMKKAAGIEGEGTSYLYGEFHFPD